MLLKTTAILKQLEASNSSSNFDLQLASRLIKAFGLNRLETNKSANNKLK